MATAHHPHVCAAHHPRVSPSSLLSSDVFTTVCETSPPECAQTPKPEQYSPTSITHPAHLSHLRPVFRISWWSRHQPLSLVSPPSMSLPHLLPEPLPGEQLPLTSTLLPSAQHWHLLPGHLLPIWPLFLVHQRALQNDFTKCTSDCYHIPS